MYKKIIYKSVLFIIPIILIIGIYFYLDPFKVLYHYDSYYTSGESSILELNRDYVGFENHLNQIKKNKIDSYILGNSKSRAFNSKIWSKCIDSKQAYHFDANLETIYGILNKLEYLDNTNCEIKNALFVIDEGVLIGDKYDYYSGHLFCKHYQYSDNSFLKFHYSFFSAFLTYDIFVNYCKYYLTKDPSLLVSSTLFQTNNDYYNPKTNDLSFKFLELKIKQDSLSFYKQFPERTEIEIINKKVISDKSYDILKKINKILIKHNTKYKFVISPSFTFKKLNQEDIAILSSIFGANKIYNFSGLNNFSKSSGNFYESTHYRECVANQIMNQIYAK